MPTPISSGAMAVIMDRFSAGYVDIQGDGIFGLFSGPSSEFQAMACAITRGPRCNVTSRAGFRKVPSRIGCCPQGWV